MLEILKFIFSSFWICQRQVKEVGKEKEITKYQGIIVDLPPAKPSPCDECDKQCCPKHCHSYDDYYNYHDYDSCMSFNFNSDE